MEKINLKITKCDGRSDQCQFCLSKIQLYNIRGDRLSFVATICKECVKKISDVMISD